MNAFSYSSAQRNRNRISVLLEHKREGRLLDIGCGDGGFLALADRYFQVEGFDLNPAPIDARNSLISDQIVKADICDLDLENGVYDAITAFNVLEHILDPCSVIREVYLGLKPRGNFFGSVPNNHLPVGAIHTFLTNLGDSTHRSTFHPTKWEDSLVAAGFRNNFFFGELLLGRLGFYCFTPKTSRLISFNMMFLCTKD